MALEKINWGQFILNLETPDSVKEWNVQKELLLHNHVALRRPLTWLETILPGIVGLALI